MGARTQITIDPGLRRRAHARAAEQGISFAEYVRRIVTRDLGESRQKADVSALFDLVDDGPESDIARDQDKMLADAAWQQHRHHTGRKPSRKARPSRAGHSRR